MFINADGLECVREQEGSLKYGGENDKPFRNGFLVA